MKEYKLSITGMADYVIISPEVLRLLLQKIKDSPYPYTEIAAESIMPEGYAQYLANVLNSNRGKKKFRFCQIPEQELGKEQIYRILEYHMKNLRIEKKECFEHFFLIAEGSENKYTYSMESERHFFCICRNEESRFLYVYPDGRQECVSLKWKVTVNR